MDRSSDILDALTQIFRENFDDEELLLTPTTTAHDIRGWDSAKMVMLILAVEDRFDVRLRSREIDSLRNIQDWIDVIETARLRQAG